MKQTSRFYHGKCLSLSLIVALLAPFTQLLFSPVSVQADTLSVQHFPSRSNWRLATTKAIGAFAQIQDEPVESVHHAVLDGFTLTAYTLDVRSTGKAPGQPGYGITASGTKAQVGRTVAVDPRVIPIGSLLYLPNIGWRIAEDSGGAVKGRHIDVLLDTERHAVSFGVKRHTKIYLYE